MITEFKRAECDICGNYEVFTDGELPTEWATLTAFDTTAIVCPECLDRLFDAPKAVQKAPCCGCGCNTKEEEPVVSEEEAALLDALFHLIVGDEAKYRKTYDILKERDERK